MYLYELARLFDCTPQAVYSYCGEEAGCQALEDFGKKWNDKYPFS